MNYLLKYWVKETVLLRSDGHEAERPQVSGDSLSAAPDVCTNVSVVGLMNQSTTCGHCTCGSSQPSLPLTSWHVHAIICTYPTMFCEAVVQILPTVLQACNNNKKNSILRIYFLAYFPYFETSSVKNYLLLSFNTTRIVYKTTPLTILHCGKNVFIVLLRIRVRDKHRQTHRHTRPAILLLLQIFIAAGTCLPGRYVA
jgi:hypothetical protein